LNKKKSLTNNVLIEELRFKLGFTVKVPKFIEGQTLIFRNKKLYPYIRGTIIVNIYWNYSKLR